MSSVLSGALLLAELVVKEGLEWSWELFEAPGGKAGFKARFILGVMTAYGPSAKPYLDKIKAAPNLTRTLTAGRWKRMYDDMVKSVEGGKAEKLIPFEEAKQAGKLP